MPELKYKRVLLKLSGEALAGSKGHGVDAKTVKKPHRLQKERAKDVTAFMMRLSLRLRKFSAERLRYITAEEKELLK